MCVILLESFVSEVLKQYFITGHLSEVKFPNLYKTAFDSFPFFPLFFVVTKSLNCAMLHHHSVPDVACINVIEINFFSARKICVLSIHPEGL